VKDYLDYRTAPKVEGGVIGAKDLSYLTTGQNYREVFFYGITLDGQQLRGTLTATRLEDGMLSVTTDVDGYEPVMEGELLVGLRFPGSDRYPVQPWDEERDGPREDSEFAPITPVPVHDWGDVQGDVLNLIHIYSMMVEHLADGHTSVLGVMSTLIDELNDLEEKLDIRWDSGVPQVGGERRPPRLWKYRVC